MLPQRAGDSLAGGIAKLADSLAGVSTVSADILAGRAAELADSLAGGTAELADSLAGASESMWHSGGSGRVRRPISGHFLQTAELRSAQGLWVRYPHWW